MSEQRRATLTPFGKSDKKSNKSPEKTFRLTFTLSDPNEHSCSVFDYGAAVKSEERKALKKNREGKDKKPNGFFDPFEDNDEDVKRLARKFEAKYGDKKKLKSYAELGAGYDETDPFIDNTDACDEALQEDQETACGGYYINSGPLELKRVEVSDHSDADEVKRRGRKRSLPVIDEEEDDGEEKEEDEDEEEEGDEAEENGELEESKPDVDDAPPEPKKSKPLEERLESEKPPTPSYNGVAEEHVVKKKKKRVIEEEVDGLNKSKKAKTVKALLEEKRIYEQPVKTSEEPKRQVASETSIAEAIESVVNAGNSPNVNKSVQKKDKVAPVNNHDENSNSSSSSHSAPTASSSTSDDSQDGKPSDSPPPLPDNLTPDVVALVEQINSAAASTDNTRKTFHPDINSCLVKLEWKTRELSAANRNMLFAHLAHQLPCTKDTLMRRAKKLFIDKEESQIDNFICKLKATVDATMPTLLERYQKECQKIVAEQGLPATESTPGDEQKVSSPNDAKLPKKKFPWTDETRGYLLSIVRCKQRCFRVCKPRKNTWEEYLKTFLHSSIRPLWPPGWMKTSALNKEISRSPGVKTKSSSHHSKNDTSRPVSASATPTPANVTLSVASSGDTQTTVSTPLTAKTGTGADPLNLLTKITSSLPQQKPPVKSEKEFSMDCLLKRTSDDYNTTLSDLMKKDGLIVNGLSLPLKNVNQNNNKSENVLDLSGCNNSASAMPSVIQSISSERAATSLGDTRVSSSEKLFNHTSPSGKEAMSYVPLNRKQRLLQSPEYHRNSETFDVSVIKKTDFPRFQSPPEEEKVKRNNSGGAIGDKPQPPSVPPPQPPPPPRERELEKETTTATDILSHIISESLRSPPQQPYNPPPPPVKAKEETKSQELLYDVMQELQELNHMSGGGKDTKSNSFSGSWSYPVKSMETPKANPYHNEYLNYLQHSGNSAKDSVHATSTPSQLPYSRHSTSPYENSPYVNEVNKSLYSHSSHRTNQNLSTYASSPMNKASHMNQMKNHANSGISSGLPHRYMGQMDYNEDPHLMGLPSSLQYNLNNWQYPGSESQSHQ